MPGAEWFPGAELNFAEHVFAGKADDALALQAASEVRATEAWDWGRLRAETARDRRRAAGARGRPGRPGRGVPAEHPRDGRRVPRLRVDRRRVVLGGTGVRRALGDRPLRPDRADGAAGDRRLPLRRPGLLARRPGARDRAAMPGTQLVRLGYLDGSGWEDGFLGADGARSSSRAVPFDHPLWVLYSSGTTGLPKAIVHSQGGILLEHLKKGLHLDAQPGDRVFWFSTTGWMMWNFLVGVLLGEASIVLFDGNPGYPALGRLWDLAAETGMTTFGTSAAFIASCLKAEVHPRAGRDLSALRAVGSTGSPLSPEGFRWVYDELGVGDLAVLDLGRHRHVHRVRRRRARCCRCTSASSRPGAWGRRSRRGIPTGSRSWARWASSSSPSRCRRCRSASGAIPTGERYHDAYFSMYPGVWRHGDWIEITERGTAIIYGRSDSTINRGGVRMGTSEIYRAVLSLEAVLDALVVDVPREGAENWMPLFVVLREGASLDDGLVGEIRRRVREDCSPRHVPDEVRQIAEVPRTLSGKVLEVPVKRILMGEAVDRAASRESLANPAALDPFVTLASQRVSVVSNL